MSTKAKVEKPQTEAQRANRDPLSGAPGAHPVGAGAGAVAGGAAGAAIGTAVGGPVGGVAGAAIGGIAGGLAGKGAAEAVDPTVESAYWRKNFSTRPYYEATYTYEDYEPAYRYGWEARGRHVGKDWNTVEPDLKRDWEKNSKKSNGWTWDKAKQAVRDAWNRL